MIIINKDQNNLRLKNLFLSFIKKKEIIYDEGNLNPYPCLITQPTFWRLKQRSYGIYFSKNEIEITLDEEQYNYLKPLLKEFDHKYQRYTLRLEIVEEIRA